MSSTYKIMKLRKYSKSTFYGIPIDYLKVYNDGSIICELQYEFGIDVRKR